MARTGTWLNARKSSCPFLDLAPEIRERIYGHLIPDKSDDKPGSYRTWPIDPPLSCVSRLIRQELLPIFFARFVIELNMTIDENGRPRPQSRHDLWYHELHSQKLRHVRHFRFRFFNPLYSTLQPRYQWEFSLVKKTCSYKLGKGFFLAGSALQEDEDEYEYEERQVAICIQEHLKAWLVAAVSSPGVGNIRVADLDDLLGETAALELIANAWYSYTTNVLSEHFPFAV